MGYVSLLDYGADPSGVRDSTDSLRRACEENSLVYLPEGTYRIGPVTIGSVTLQGAGDGKTVLKTANLTDNLLTFSQDGWHVKDLKFTADSFRTGARIFAAARGMQALKTLRCQNIISALSWTDALGWTSPMSRRWTGRRTR